MELADVPLPPFVSRGSCASAKRREDFISTIYSTTPGMTATCSFRADNEAAGENLFPQGAQQCAADSVSKNG